MLKTWPPRSGCSQELGIHQMMEPCSLLSIHWLNKDAYSFYLGRREAGGALVPRAGGLRQRPQGEKREVKGGEDAMGR